MTYRYIRVSWRLEVPPEGTPFPSRTHPHTHHLLASHTDSVHCLPKVIARSHMHYASKSAMKIQ